MHNYVSTYINEEPVQKKNVSEILAEAKNSLDPKMWDRVSADVDASFGVLTIAIEVRHARRAAGLTQSQLANKSGITQSEISRIEQGRYSPRLSTLFTLARSLKTDFVIPGRDESNANVA